MTLLQMATMELFLVLMLSLPVKSCSALAAHQVRVGEAVVQHLMRLNKNKEARGCLSSFLLTIQLQAGDGRTRPDSVFILS